MDTIIIECGPELAPPQTDVKRHILDCEFYFLAEFKKIRMF